MSGGNRLVSNPNPNTSGLWRNGLSSRIALLGATASLALTSGEAMLMPTIASADHQTCVTKTTGNTTVQTCTSTSTDSTTPSGSRGNTTNTGIFKKESYNMDDYGSRIARSGCGDVVYADAETDFTGEDFNPYDAEKVLSPDYYIPGSGTRHATFFLLAKKLHLTARVVNLKGALETIRDGGLVVSEYNAHKAEERSGHSPIAVVDHYTLLDGVDKSGEFTMADPHYGPKRYNQTYKNGSTHYWTGKALWGAGLEYMVALERTYRTPTPLNNN